MFDLVNLDQALSEASATDLKFMALFYDGVVVPDAFLMSYTPLFRHLNLVNPSSDQDRDIISVFLSEGVIVPAIRDGDSLLRNWTDPSSAIVPGAEMRVYKKEGQKVLEFVDRNATRYTNIDLGPGTNRFGELLNAFMVGAEKPWRRALPLGSLQSPAISRLLTDFEELVQRKLTSKKKLRRLDVERLISKYLIRHHNFHDRKGFIPKLYEQLDDAVTQKPRDLGLFECQSLLNSSSTIYQAYHAYQLAALGGLFPFHDRRLMAAGLYHYLANVPGKVIEHRRAYQVKRAPVLFGSLDVSDLTVDQVIEIRRRDEFLEYVSLLKKWKNPKEGQTGYQANPAFVDHLKDKYLPMILKQYPHAGRIERTVKAVSTGAHGLLDVFEQGPSFEGVSIKGRIIIAGVKSASSALAHYPEEVGRWVHSSRMAHRKRKFLKLNQYWAKARSS